MTSSEGSAIDPSGRWNWTEMSSDMIHALMDYLPRNTGLALRLMSMRYTSVVDHYLAFWKHHFPQRLLFPSHVQSVNTSSNPLQYEDFWGWSYPDMVMLVMQHRAGAAVRIDRKGYMRKASGLAAKITNRENNISRLKQEIRALKRDREIPLAKLAPFDAQIGYMKIWKKAKEAPVRKARAKRKREEKKKEKQRQRDEDKRIKLAL